MIEELLVKPSEKMPLWQPKRFGLLEADRRVIGGTFRRLADLVHSLPQASAADCLLLLTTCRNQWYTVNALYVEAQKWCSSGEGKHGFGDALDALAKGLSDHRTLTKNAKRISRLFNVAAGYLEEFEKKHDLFFNRFDRVQTVLSEYGRSISDPPARTEFQTTFARVGNGPGTPEDSMNGPSSPESDVYLQRLLEWFALTRPLTSLARTFIGDVLGIAPKHPKGLNCFDYLRQIEAAAVDWHARGFPCPKIPPKEVFEPIRDAVKGDSSEDQNRSQEFLIFCDEAYSRAIEYLSELLPANKPSDRKRFPLRRPSANMTVSIGTKTFKLMPNMFVFITDMRNSTGDRFITPELKVKIEEVIERLRSQANAASQTLYDDSRVVACDSLENLGICVRRIHSVLKTYQTPEGFAGIRIGSTRGEMLFGYDSKDDFKDIRRTAPLDSADNTIATAARLMGLDKLRFEVSSPEGKAFCDALGDWVGSNDLLFLDSRLYEELSPTLQLKCRNVSILELKGIGKRDCWAIPIEAFVTTAETTASALESTSRETEKGDAVQFAK